MTGLECLDNLCRALSVFAPWPPPKLLYVGQDGGEGLRNALMRQRIESSVVDVPGHFQVVRLAEEMRPRPFCPRCGWPGEERTCVSCRHRELEEWRKA